MIAARQTRLVEVADLAGFRLVLATLASPADPIAARRTAVILPNRAAAATLRRTLENLVLGSARALVLPHLLTRDDWYGAMYEELPDPPPRLTRQEREVLVGRAARAAAAGGCPPPFRLHDGLIGEILAFYDDLHARRRTVDAFERLVVDDLAPRADTDRGAERLLRQTRFLVALFRAYQASLHESGAVDEAALRDRLLQERAVSPFRRLVITVGDQAANRAGLSSADLDLVARIDGLEHVDVVATERALAAGLGDRLAEALPGIDRQKWPATGTQACALLAPAREPARLHWNSRDREEELSNIARWIKWSRLTDDGRPAAAVVGRPAKAGAPLERTAVVFRRPLPYVYLAQSVFDAGGIPYQTSDALPLASEPYAGAIDLLLTFVSSRFARSETIALLRSPHFTFAVDGHRLARGGLGVAQRLLVDERCPGGLEEWRRLAAEGLRPRSSRGSDQARALAAVKEAASAAAAAAAELEPMTRRRAASAQLETLLAFLAGHRRESPDGRASDEAQLRARAAIVTGLGALRRAYARYDDIPCTVDELAPRIRRWLETETFAPRRGSGGVHLLDAQAAAYGDFDDVWLVGVIDGEWPERPPASVFYPAALLRELGWTRDRDALAAARAAFDDLLRLPRERIAISTFTLEDDAIVEPSALLEDVDRSGIDVLRVEAPPRLRIFADEALATDPARCDVLAPAALAWAQVRQDRPPADDPRFHGAAGAAGLSSYTVTSIEEYLKCPFRYFARYVLRLPDETGDEAALAPRVLGQLVHEVLRAFFKAWGDDGHGAITIANEPEARRRFRSAADAALERLAPAEAQAAHLKLFGSAFSPGAWEIVSRLELERGKVVIQRLLEFALDGDCPLESAGQSRTVRLRGVADRIDLLGDGTLQVIDYKLGRPPGARYAVQLPVYALRARLMLAGHLGRHWSIGDASYVSLSGGESGVTSLAGHAQGLQQALADGQARVLAAVDGIEHGRFPPRPADTFLCASCPYATVCRKEYAGDDEPAPAV